MNKTVFVLVLIPFLFSCSKNDDVMLAVRKQQKALPQKVNSFITWKEIKLEEKTIINVYVVNEDGLNLPLVMALAELKLFGKTNILNGLKANAGMKSILRKGYTFRYRYFDNDAKQLYEFDIVQADMETNSNDRHE